MDHPDYDTLITPWRSPDGKEVTLTMKSGQPITMHEFLAELEQYLLLVSKAAKERIQVGADN